MSSSPCQCSGVDAVVAAARAAGACAAAFVRLEALDDADTALYDNWIARGANAGMDYLARYSDIRRDPRLLLDGAQSMLVAAFAYAPTPDRRSRLIADYALGDDYHTVLRERLNPVAALMEGLHEGSATRICIDTAPLRERLWAARAGLGLIGLNNQLIIPGIGSRVFLAEILWTAPIPQHSKFQIPNSKSCISCRRCVDACPGGALDGKGGIDAGRCLSYLTIEHRGDLPEDLSLRGRRIYGCDICQDVCPFNKVVPPEPVTEFAPRPAVASLTLDDIAAMDAETFSLTFARSAVKRTKLSGLLRNAAKAREE